MIRRDFLRSTGLVSLGGLLLGPQLLEAWDRLTWKRTLFPGFSAGPLTSAEWDALFARAYASELPNIVEAINLATPFVNRLKQPRSLYAPADGQQWLFAVSVSRNQSGELPN